eukprot:jgi/Phyca11/126984/e_gw1.66.112.1
MRTTVIHHYTVCSRSNDLFIADIQQVRRDWKALGLRLESCEKIWHTRKQSLKLLYGTPSLQKMLSILLPRRHSNLELIGDRL